MGVHDLYSKRQARLRGDVPDIYVYDDMPEQLRVQIVHILHEAIGKEQCDFQGKLTDIGRWYQTVVRALRKEYGVFVLPGWEEHYQTNYVQELSNFILTEPECERILDAVELSFRLIDRIIRNYLQRGKTLSSVADDAIAELNTRFKEHGVGYEYSNGQIIRVDSEFIHSEVVKRALVLMHDPAYSGVEQEFLSAHEHYRSGKYKEALVDALKSLESTLKVICDKRSWSFDAKATCSTLIQRCFDNELIPPYWNGHFSGLRSTLESGVPTARNRLGGHGQGSQLSIVPDYLVAYVLHQTASAIVFLVEAEHQMP
jgi:hypothetical protein